MVRKAKTGYEVRKQGCSMGAWHVRPARTTQNGGEQAGQYVTQHARNAAAHCSCTSHTTLACPSERVTLCDGKVMYANPRSRRWTEHRELSITSPPSHRMRERIGAGAERKTIAVSRNFLVDDPCAVVLGGRGWGWEKDKLTTGNLEYTTASNGQDVLVNPYFHTTARDMEDHVHG